MTIYMSIPWFYTWSEPVFDKVLQDTIKGFNLKGLQSDVSTLKDRAALIVATLKQTSEPAIVFSVSDLIVKPEFPSEISKLESEMVFLDGPKGKLQTGVLYLKNNSDVLDFWTSVASSDKSTLEESTLEFKGKWSKFSDKCKTTDTWDKRSDFHLLELVSSGYGKEFDFAEKIFTMAQHIELQPYMQYVSEDIIPFIYKIQELMFLTHKEMKNA
jgi:hypothetical protein